jgi:tripartite-type tricarboxylate transporter receptor subunit TctC
MRALLPIKTTEGAEGMFVILWVARFVGLVALAGLAVAGPMVAVAQEYPSRPISLVVAFPAGGGVDTVGRVVAQKLTDALGQQVIVVNRPGAGSVIGTRDVARAQPEGTRCSCW